MVTAAIVTSGIRSGQAFGSDSAVAVVAAIGIAWTTPEGVPTAVSTEGVGSLSDGIGQSEKDALLMVIGHSREKLTQEFRSIPSERNTPPTYAD